MSSLSAYIVRRILWIIPVFFVVTAITFALGRYGPGDPIEVRTQGRADPETVERVREELGLNQPVPLQYVRYMADFFQGDMGESISKYPGVPVWELIRERIWITAQLNIVSLVILFWLGIALGSFAAMHVGGWKDPAIISFLLIFQAIPTMVFIPILLWLFVVKLSWLPAAGWDGLLSLHIVIPLIALVLPSLAGVARLMRVSLLGTMGQDWVRTARAKGLPERTVFFRHIFRPSLLPLTTSVGGSLASIFGGSLFVELLYGIPGMGRLALDAVYARDYDIIMAVFIISALAFLFARLITDVAYTFIDPRIRLGAESR
ncbi:MAG: hypothetical protein A2806_02810 [Candidatus Terrybacteria bacterium RIFCSPHIGHO2_01_FULL_48_17]|uniref:ABC transmembrane type-1 domain-containing protein n=1 Tax=Candidatus Terrybacteria bacterium RIFCSPHIGHO2_01_FULL_48_17 TaxID=1802362 RepID=A0A1G2PJI8_9BACT|nr:MAG: hypothetical protein A2806_02810 [Candidatus Terrybacteria bacterium RIFCSPHIGHO2_01_FULL_48_17]OHA52568.1 MAG: hypothetical protein A3A30_00855 [Candidatus Terrybacteria bacterium RIFCSPLOWO2_01_FULL_48_14]